MTKAPLYVSGIIFAIFALVHLYRLYSHFTIVIGTTEIPLWGNVLAAIVAGGLSIWMFYAGSTKGQRD